MFSKIKEKVSDTIRTNFTSSETVYAFNQIINEEKWGPAPPDMDVLARMYPSGFYEMLPEMQLRLDGRNTSWRRCYKTLLLIEHFARVLDMRYVDDLKAFLPTLDEIFRSYHHTDSQSVDRGVSVRERAKKVIAILREPDVLREERRRNDKFRGSGGGSSVSSDGASSGPSRHTGSNHTGDKFVGFGSSTGVINSASAHYKHRENDHVADDFHVSPSTEGPGPVRGGHYDAPVDSGTLTYTDWQKRRKQEEDDHRLALELQRQEDGHSRGAARQSSNPHGSHTAASNGRHAAPAQSSQRQPKQQHHDDDDFGELQAVEIQAQRNAPPRAPQATDEFGDFVGHSPITATPKHPPATTATEQRRPSLDFFADAPGGANARPTPAKPQGAPTIDDLFGPTSPSVPPIGSRQQQPTPAAQTDFWGQPVQASANTNYNQPSAPNRVW